MPRPPSRRDKMNSTCTHFSLLLPFSIFQNKILLILAESMTYFFHYKFSSHWCATNIAIDTATFTHRIWAAMHMPFYCERARHIAALAAAYCRLNFIGLPTRFCPPILQHSLSFPAPACFAHDAAHVISGRATMFPHGRFKLRAGDSELAQEFPGWLAQHLLPPRRLPAAHCACFYPIRRREAKFPFAMP